jgi:hypothetical protein
MATAKGGTRTRRKYQLVAPQAKQRAIDTPKAYYYLYQQHGNGVLPGTGAANTERYATNPAQELSSKFGPDANAEAAIQDMIDKGWAEWRPDFLQDKKATRKLYLIASPSEVRSERDSDKAPVTASSHSVSSSRASSRRRHPDDFHGAYLVPLELAIWRFFSLHAGAPERWNPEQAPQVSEDELLKATRSKTEDLREAVGRLCAAKLLSCVAPSTFRLDSHPSQVLVAEITHRRIILAPKPRMNQISTLRAIAKKLQRHDGTILSAAFSAEAMRALSQNLSGVMNMALDYSPEQTSGAGRSLRLLVREEDRRTLLLAPESLTGCDFFLNAEHNRSVLVMPNDRAHETYAEKLRRRYCGEAEWKDGPPSAGATVARPRPAAATTPAPTPPTASEGRPTASARLDRVRERREELIRIVQQHATDEQRALTEASELRQRLSELDTQAATLGQLKRNAESELQRLDSEFQQLDEIERQLADLNARRSALLSGLKLT